MNNNFNNNVKQLWDILANENISESLINILSLLANSSKKEKPPEETEKENHHKDSQNNQKNKSEEDFYNNDELVRKVKSIMNDANSLNDPRINLLTAIKPFLNSSRQKKVGDCIKLFQMFHLSNVMADIEKSM